MEKLDCIHPLMNRGRSKGVSVLIGIQTVEGVYEVYGENGAEDILAQCASKTMLRANAPKTAEWAERYFGKVRFVEPVWSESWSKDGGTTSVNYSRQERSLFLSSYFLDLPFPAVGGPYVAISDAPSLRSSIISSRMMDELIAMTKRAPEVNAIVMRENPKEQSIETWSDEEQNYYCGKVEAPKTTPSKPSPRRHGRGR